MGEQTGRQTYVAFISYTHAEPDTKIAAWLQRQLEHFRIPKHIQKETGRSQIGRVFRDVEELSLTTDLSQEIKEALAGTEYLIVVCSAKAAASQWVAREIDFFTSLHGDEKILTVLADGEPQDVIPAKLREGGREPLSCDCRMPLRMAKREELPRLAAALLGCSYDALRQRQRQYRARRNGVIAVCASVTFVCVTGYLTWNNLRIRRLLHESQVGSSRILARSSMENLESGDRIRAIELALEALCGTEPGEERPEIPEAVHALEESLSAYVPAGRFHIEAARAFPVQQEICSALTSPDGTYLVICTEQKLEIYDTVSGAVIVRRAFREKHSREAAQPVFDGKDGFYISDGSEFLDIRFSDGTEQCRIRLSDEEDAEIRSIVPVPGEGGKELAAAASYDSVVLIDPEAESIAGKLHAEEISTEKVRYRLIPSYRKGQNMQDTADASRPEILPSADGKKIWICAGVAGIDYGFDRLVCWDITDGSWRVLEPKQSFQTGQSVLLLPGGDPVLAGFTQREDFAGNTTVRKTFTAPAEEQRNSGKLTVVRIDQETGKVKWRKQIPYSGGTDSGVHMILAGTGADRAQSMPAQPDSAGRETASRQAETVRLAVAVSEELCIFDSETGKEQKAEHEPSEILTLYTDLEADVQGSDAQKSGIQGSNAQKSGIQASGAEGSDAEEPDAGVRCFLRNGAVTTEHSLLYGFVDSAKSVHWISPEQSATGYAMWYLNCGDRIIQYQLGSGNAAAELLEGLRDQEEAAEGAAVLMSEEGMLLETVSGDGTGAFSWFPAGDTACAWQWKKPDMASAVPAGFTRDAKKIVLTERALADGMVRWRLILLNTADGTAEYAELPLPDSAQETTGKQDGLSGEMPGGMLLPDASAGQVLAVSDLDTDRIAYVIYSGGRTQLGIYNVSDGTARFSLLSEEALISPVLAWETDGGDVIAVLSEADHTGNVVWKRIGTDEDDVEDLPFTVPASGTVCIASDGKETAVCRRGGSIIQIAGGDDAAVREIGDLQYAALDLFLCGNDLFVLEESGRLHRYDRNTLLETGQIETIPFSEKTAGSDLSKTESVQKRVQWAEDPDGRLWIHYAEELAVVDLEGDCLRTAVHDCIGSTPGHEAFFVITDDVRRIPGKLPYYTTAELVEMGKEQTAAEAADQNPAIE